MVILDDSSVNMPFLSPICSDCIHWQTKLIRGCKAFPTLNGIPKEIWKGKHDHSTPFPGDHGIMFERTKR